MFSIRIRFIKIGTTCYSGNPNKYRLQNTYFIKLNTDKIRTSVITEKTTYIDIPEVPRYQYMCQIHTSHCHFMIRHGSGQSSAERPYCAVLLWNACLFSGYMYKDWRRFDEGTCFLTSPLISLQHGPLCLVMGRCSYRLVACNL